jgi:hypothetical protein
MTEWHDSTELQDDGFKWAIYWDGSAWCVDGPMQYVNPDKFSHWTLCEAPDDFPPEPKKPRKLSLRQALEKIALLDEADGHELTVQHAQEAVAIASRTLGKHPSEIYSDRRKRGHD